MKIKKICSFLVACLLLCGSVGVMESHTNTAYAMPSEQVGIASWVVWGNDLHHEIPLAKTRHCPQGLGVVIAIINRCIREGRHLNVYNVLGKWFYRMLP